ncbi:kynurenine 3-monooxygenase [Nemania sp. FL0916]|nr:kynurenine 3-monooxygenase [Nemania sp. FL0916]
MLESTDKVAIIGGGLGGMAAALALHELKIKCSVYEMRDTHAAPPTSSGALMLSPNMLRIVERFGLVPEIQKKSFPFEYVYYKDADEQTIDRYPLGDEAAFGYKAQRIYRQDLLNILYEACFARNVPIHFGKKFAGVIEETGSSVTFKFADGSTETASLLIGSDGIHSKVREYICPGVPKKYLGLSALTWETPTKQLRVPEDKDYKFPVSVLTSNGAFVLAPQRPDGSAMLAGTQFPVAEDLVVDRQKWNEFMADKSALVERAKQNIDVWPDIAKSSIEDINVETMNVWPFFSIPRLFSWTSASQQRVVILGDAAHAIPPTTGNGASQAFEDAFTLSLILSALRGNKELKWENALRFWQDMRQDRIDELMILTRQLNNKRLPLEKQKLLPENELWFDESADNPRQMAWLYDPKLEETVDAWVKEAKRGRG